MTDNLADVAAERFLRAPGVVSELAGDQALLVDAEGVELITLNRVGTLLWERLTEARTCADLSDVLAQRFPGQPRDVLDRDVGEFLTELRSAGLIDAAD